MYDFVDARRSILGLSGGIKEDLVQEDRAAKATPHYPGLITRRHTKMLRPSRAVRVVPESKYEVWVLQSEGAHYFDLLEEQAATVGLSRPF